MGSPVADWRRRLAYRVVSGHGLAMFVVFIAPLMFFLTLLSKEHEGAALLVGGLMAGGFVGTLWLAPRLMAVSPRPASRRTLWQAVLRRFRVFVGNGEAIQAVARRIDPEWRNPLSGRTLHQTATWLASMEQMHWAVLAASIAPIAATFWYGHHVLGFAYVAANLLYNIAPNLVIRDTRRRLLRITRRTSALGPDGNHQRCDVVPALQIASNQVYLATGPAEQGAAVDPAP